MGKFFFDLSDGEFAYALSDDVAMDFDGNMMMRMSDNMAMDMDSGDLHFVTGWENEDQKIFDPDKLDDDFDDYEY